MPKIVSDEEKKKKGTFQKCRARTPVKWATANTIDEVTPTGLNADGLRAWKMAIAQAPKGLLSPTDAHLLKRWCDCFSQYEYIHKTYSNAEMTITNAQGNFVTAPWFYQMRSLSAEMLNIEKQLGFTPLARARVRVVDDKPKDENPFIDFMNDA